MTADPSARRPRSGGTLDLSALINFCEGRKAEAYTRLDKMHPSSQANGHQEERARNVGRAQAFSEVLTRLESVAALRAAPPARPAHTCHSMNPPFPYECAACVEERIDAALERGAEHFPAAPPRPEAAGVCWCDRYKAAGGGTCEPCQIRALTADLDHLRAALARVKNDCKNVVAALQVADARAETAEARIAVLQGDIQALQSRWDARTQALETLSAKWKAEGARIDTFHATMGSGYKACAADLDALAAGDRETP